MTCPVCGGKTGVTDTKNEVDCIYRRRKCKECGYIFCTEEIETREAKHSMTIIRNKLKRGIV